MSSFKKIIPSKRTQHIAYAIRDILSIAKERQAAGGDLIYLNIGDPILFDFDTPPHLIESTYVAMKSRHTGYSPSEGIHEAIESIQRYVRTKNHFEPYEVMITNGASEGIDFALSAIVNKGDNVLLPSPGYPLYSAIMSRLLGESKFYKLDEKNAWQPDIEHLESQIDERTKAIVIINPNNPTGAVYNKETLLAIIDIARRHNLPILSDEIYEKLILDGQPHISIASLDSELPMITFNGLSKCYLAPGFRIGWAVASGAPELLEDYIEAMRKLGRARLCACHPGQYAITPALNGNDDHIQKAIAKMRARRDLTVERLNAIQGISCQSPNGAFYAFPRVDVEMEETEFVKKLIKETGVVVVHGSGFGPYPDTAHFRLVFLPTLTVLNDAYDRIDKFMKKHFGG